MVLVGVTCSGDGSVRITRAAGGAIGSGAAFTRTVLDVAGGVLAWPVEDAAGVPEAVVDDAGRAQQWLWAVYGEEVAAAVHACADGGGADAVRVEARCTELAGSAARLAFGHWAARWWPASYLDAIPSLEPGLLGVESAALTYRCQQLFDLAGDQPDDCAAELIEEHAAALGLLLRWCDAAPWHAPSIAPVLKLVCAAAENAGLAGPELAAVEAFLDGHRPASGPADPAALTALFPRPDGYALAAGEPLPAANRVLARGRGVNDWRRYPPGFVDASEDAVSWTVRAAGARRRIEVDVVAGERPGSPTGAPSLAAEVLTGADLPAHRIPLGRRDDVWTGRADLDLPFGHETALRVGVLLPGFSPGPEPVAGAFPEPAARPGTERVNGPAAAAAPAAPGAGRAGPDAGRSDRDAVRALARRRLAAAAEPTSPGTPMGPFLAELAAAAVDQDF